MSGTESARSDNLIRGTCSINYIPLIVVIDTSAILLFISLGCAKKLNMEMSHMVGSITIDTLSNGLVTTLWVV